MQGVSYSGSDVEETKSVHQADCDESVARRPLEDSCRASGGDLVGGGALLTFQERLKRETNKERTEAHCQRRLFEEWPGGRLAHLVG